MFTAFYSLRKVVASSEAKIAQPRMVVGSATQWPEKLAAIDGIVGRFIGMIWMSFPDAYYSCEAKKPTRATLQ
jgi:hypothetical protein